MSRFVLSLVLVIAAQGPARAVPPQDRRVRLVSSEVSDALTAASFAELSPDSRHLYVTSWRAGTVRHYACDPRDGSVELKDSLAEDPDLRGATDFRLSKDGLWGVVSCWTSKSLILFSRDPRTGELTKSDAASDASDAGETMVFPIDLAFSADGRFAYAADCVGRREPDAENGGRIVVYRREAGKLVRVQTFNGADNCLDNVRGLTLTPDQKTALATCMGRGTLAVLDRDPETGRLTMRHYLEQARDKLPVLNGAFTPTCSPDGRFVYTASGRFLSDQSEPHGVGVFRFDQNGRLVHVQSVRVENTQLHLRGCNQLDVSRDSRRLFVSGTLSGTFASFLRDKSTGKLTLEHELNSDQYPTLKGANGIAESHDSKYIYVTGEDANAINVMRVYRRKQPGKGERGV